MGGDCEFEQRSSSSKLQQFSLSVFLSFLTTEEVSFESWIEERSHDEGIEVLNVSSFSLDHQKAWF